jgi:hypothetical protein
LIIQVRQVPECDVTLDIRARQPGETDKHPPRPPLNTNTNMNVSALPSTTTLHHRRSFHCRLNTNTNMNG